MSRDLEREYRALVDSGAPDLWSRIEAGLEDKKAASRMENRRSRKVNFRVWAGIAAACACVALIVPVMVRDAGMGGGSSSNSSPAKFAADTTAQSYEKAENAVLEAAADEEAAPEAEPYTFHATVEILDTDMRMDSGVLYTARVISSEHPDMEADSEIRIFCSAVSLEETGTYELALCEDRSEEMGQGVTYLLVSE